MKEELEKILPIGDDYTHAHLKLEKRDKNCWVLEYGKMYKAPTLNLAVLIELSELFGTKEIDVDDYSYGGCETCDWGSDYGHTIQIYNPTKNLEGLKEWEGKYIYGGC